MLYRALLIIDGLAALAALGFFVLGLADGSIEDYNFSSWLILLAGLGVIIGGGIVLHRNGNQAGAHAILLILAAPALAAAMMLLFSMIPAPTSPRWN